MTIRQRGTQHAAEHGINVQQCVHTGLALQPVQGKVSKFVQEGKIEKGMTRKMDIYLRRYRLGGLIEAFSEGSCFGNSL
jgi:hypothetical protein